MLCMKGLVGMLWYVIRYAMLQVYYQVCPGVLVAVTAGPGH